MPVAKELFQTLSDLYRSLPDNLDERGTYLVERRSEIKLLVDTIWEQSIARILQSTPRNHMEARQLINQTTLSTLPGPDAEVLQSLLAVLDAYDTLDGNPYIDRSQPLVRLITPLLSQLCLKLTSHPLHRNDDQAKRLSALLLGLT